MSQRPIRHFAPERPVPIERVRYAERWFPYLYLGVVATGPAELLVVYDVQQYVENWNAYPFNGVRMLRVRVC